VASVDAPETPRTIREGSRVRLLEIDPTWYPQLHAGLTHPAVASTWRWRGRSVPSSDFERLLFHDVARLAVVVDAAERLVGVASLTNLETGDGHAELSVAELAPFLGSGLIVQGAMLFVDECFACFDLRKIYLNLTEDSATRLSGALRQAATTEGTLRDHFHINGRRQDLIVAAITPSSFAASLRSSAVARAMSPSGWSCLDGSVTDPVNGAPARRPQTPDDLDRCWAQVLRLELGTFGDDLDLRTDLGLDSMTMLELLCALDTIAGREVPLEVLNATATVGDLRRLGRQLAGQHTDDTLVARSG
jgi:acyl carrier protein/RimJ/RimL family protein N-acetyltransferase